MGFIEMDGEFHNRDNKMNGQTKEYNKSIDEYKDGLAKKYNIEVIRIECIKSDLEYIKNNILNSRLIKIFNLNNIDWHKVEKFALSNLVKIACEYKNKNTDLTTTEIGKMMNLDSGTIKRYLIKANKIEWCIYNANEEKIKRNKKIVKLRSKKSRDI